MRTIITGLAVVLALLATPSGANVLGEADVRGFDDFSEKANRLIRDVADTTTSGPISGCVLNISNSLYVIRTHIAAVRVLADLEAKMVSPMDDMLVIESLRFQVKTFLRALAINRTVVNGMGFLCPY